MTITLRNVFLLVALGLLLIMLGNGIPNDWLCLVGSVIFALSLFGGGFFLKEESKATKITMLAIAGLATISMMSIGSYIPGF